MEFNENQKQAIDFYEGCCNVIAAPGSGKTAVLVHRIQNLVMNHGVDPTKILAITFSKKAKENMMERLKKLLPDYYNFLRIETFHSFGYSIIRKFNRTGYNIIDAEWKKNSIIEGIYKDLFYARDIPGSVIVEFTSYISNQKNHLKFPNPKSKDDFEKVYNRYEQHKRENYLLDFDDMLTLAYETLRDNERALDYCQKQHQFILADEMQDTNAAQYEMIRLIAQKHPNVFFVSDPAQCIYQWRSSDNKYVLDFDKEWEKSKPTTINLNINYRSSRDIVSMANRFIKTIPESKTKHYIETVSFKPEFKPPVYSCYMNEVEEASQIAEQIQSMNNSDDYNYGDFAILARTNAQLARFEAAMHKCAIPYTIIDGLPFVEHKEVKIVLSYLKLAYDASDNTAFAYIYNKPNRYLSKQFLEETKRCAVHEKKSLLYAMNTVASRNRKFAAGIRELADTVNYLTSTKFDNVGEQIRFLRNKLKLDAYVSDEVSDENNKLDKVDNLNTLTDIAAEYTSTEEFISYMSKLALADAKSDSVVKLMTIHKAKGLEFPVVYIVGVNDTILPHHRNDNVNEERRLMYVAITRAEKELYVSSTMRYGKKDTQPSEFIGDLFGKQFI